LSTSILRPDQIYAVEFNGEHGSQVKRFSEEQPRLAQNLEKNVSQRVFGGLPNYEINKDKSIGRILFIVEEAKTEFSLFR